MKDNVPSDYTLKASGKGNVDIQLKDIGPDTIRLTFIVPEDAFVMEVGWAEWLALLVWFSEFTSEGVSLRARINGEG